MQLRILQIFNCYREYGGEEGSVARIASTLSQHYDIHTYYGSTAEHLARPFGKWRMAGWMIKNQRVLDELRDLHEKSPFSFWQIHNVFPAISIAIYHLASELGVPVIQYLHNYRFGCAAGTNFRDGSICNDCKPGNNRPAIIHRCWRNSLPATMAMTHALDHFWKSNSATCIKAFIAISEAQKNHHAALGIPADRIHVVRHFLDPGTAPAHSPPAMGDVLFLGRLVEEKGLDLLLDAWAMVNSRGRTLRIVGDGPLLATLQTKINSMGIRNVAIDGFIPREHHDALWQRASIFVAPSVWNEPFGMVVLEAWRNARPVLATNIGSFPELIRHGETGWLAPPNPSAFAHSLQAAIDSGEKCIDMGRAGRNELISNFNQDRWLREISHIYHGVNPTT